MENQIQNRQSEKSCQQKVHDIVQELGPKPFREDKLHEELDCFGFRYPAQSKILSKNPAARA